jgi:hypothetical protein
VCCYRLLRHGQFFRNVVSGVSEIVIMLETHSLTHVHKRVSAELVKHAPSGAPEQLICCRCTEAAPSPRHRAPIACAARTRVRSSASAVVTAVTAVTDGGMHGDLLEREAIGRASVM